MNRIRIGIVGLHFGRTVVKELLTGPGATHFEIAALCDLDPARVEPLAAEIGARAFLSFEEFLKESGVQAVGLFTGPNGRAGMIRRILAAGMHVMTTKPFEADPEEALKVLQEARAMGKVLHMNSPAPLPNPMIRRIGEWVAKYDLGRPVACRTETWVSYHETPDGTWYDSPSLCPAAPVFRLGIYGINDLVRLFGPADRIQVVQSRISTGRPTADNAQLSILFRNGAIGNVFASFAVDDGQSYCNTMVLNYERGTIFRGARSVETGKVHEPNALTLVTLDGERRPVVENARVDCSSGEYQWETFSMAIRGMRFEEEITPEEIVAGLRITHAMVRAQETGCTEPV